METKTKDFNEDELIYRPPTLNDGHKIYTLIKNCPPLDLNSSYAYFLLADHFSETCVVIEKSGQIIGFISAYLKPREPETLFIWQIAVHREARGMGLAKKMLQKLVSRSACANVTEIQTTISPDNQASQKALKSFAAQLLLQTQVEDYLSSTHFPGETHEAEDLYRFIAPATHTLKDLI